MNTKRVVLPLVVVTLLTASYAIAHSAAGIAQPTRVGATSLPDDPRVPALETPFAVQDTPELAAAPPSAPPTAAKPAPESDVDHVARLMAAVLRCGDTHANDVGGRSSECASLPAK